MEGIDSSYFKKDPSKKETTEVAKNVAVIAPMKHEPEVESTKKVIKTEVVNKKKVATPPPTPPPPKVVRKRVTAPSPEKPVAKKPRARISAPDNTVPEPDSKPIPVLTTKEECKFWPRCKRGDECLYLHPKALLTASGSHVSKPISTSTIMPPAKDKFKWTK